MFAAPDRQTARYMVSHGFFKKGEIADICVRHMDVDAEMTTRELPERVMAERDLDISDGALRNSVVSMVVQALRHRHVSNCFGVTASGGTGTLRLCPGFPRHFRRCAAWTETPACNLRQIMGGWFCPRSICASFPDFGAYRIRCSNPVVATL